MTNINPTCYWVIPNPIYSKSKVGNKKGLMAKSTVYLGEADIHECESHCSQVILSKTPTYLEAFHFVLKIHSCRSIRDNIH